jgi:hypothetical protein
MLLKNKDSAALLQMKEIIATGQHRYRLQTV